MRRVDGRLAVVTGGGGGIGSAVAARLAENGARIVVTDISAPALERTVESLAAGGIAGVGALVHEVSSEESWVGVMAEIARNFGPVDIVVNSAGIFSTIGQPFDEIPFDEWRRIISINLDGAFLGTRFGVQAMKGRGGAIINVSSTAGYVGTRAGAAYGASKAGVRSLTVQAAISCAAHGYNIRINSISPGYVWTPAIEAKMLAAFGSREAGMRVAAGRNPLGRVAEPDDVAWAAVYLASDEARMITAFDMVIDGGMLHATQVRS